MRAKITKKVEGGKLLRLELELGETLERVKSLKITGDFFIHPEESLQIIEKALLMAPIEGDAATLSKNLSELAKSQGIQMIGITPEAVAETFLEAVKQAKGAKQ